MKETRDGGLLGPLELAFSRSQIMERIEGLAQEIAGYYESPMMESVEFNGLFVVGVLKGAKPFVRKLVPRLRLNLAGVSIEVDFMQVRTRDQGNQVSELSISRDVPCVEGRDVLLLDDIVDGGKTMEILSRYLAVCRSAKTVTTCALLRRKFADDPNPLLAQFVGFELLRPEWVIGFGLDCKIGEEELGRDMSDIWYVLGTGGD